MSAPAGAPAASPSPTVGPLRVLDAANPADRMEWLRLWHAWPDREVMAHPAYATLFARGTDRCLCASQDEDSGGGVLFPFILRNLSVEPWCAGSTDSDIVSPYGYGGAFCWGRPDAARFWSAFEAWALERNVVTAFTRLSLFASQLLPWPWEVVEQQPNVVRSTTAAPTDLWLDYEHKVRKNVKRAVREGLRFEIDAAGGRLDEFLAVYDATMERRTAAARYRLGREFFRAIIRDLPGHFMFFHVLRGDDVVSSELVLVSARRCYSFLGGTAESAFALRPNDLLKHGIIEWAGKRGLESFVLGGGAAPADGVFRYKRSFAPGGVVPFRCGRHVFRTDAYRRLLAQRRDWAAVTTGEHWQPPVDFFPAYRG